MRAQPQRGFSRAMRSTSSCITEALRGRPGSRLAFFRVRLPPLEREDVKRTVTELGIAPDDEFALLAAVGRRTIASPYELELREPENRGGRPGHPALAHP